MIACLASQRTHFTASHLQNHQATRSCSLRGLKRASLGHMSTSVPGVNGHSNPSSSTHPAQPSGQASPSSEERSPLRTPLSFVVTDAVKRWYVETNKEAVKGDVKQQALLGQMLLEGYGCDVNQSAARMWIDKAKRRGYRMAGVYCEL